VSGPVVARGYYKNPEATASTFPTGSDGVRYLRTGDLGSMDGDGFLQVHL
jgi:long-subunit acyl-CoA synthetase (AMP-forming)